MLTSAIPDRFRIEPLDVRAYDRWMDREALLDASPACREAWKAFRPEWRAARDADVRAAPVVEWRKTEGVPAELRRCAAAFGLLDDPRGPALVEHERCAWWAFRARVMQADPTVWAVLWAYTGGQPVSLTADRHGVTARYVLSAVALCCRWWLDLWRRCGPIRVV